MVLTAIPAQVAHAQGGYSEKLNVYVSGSTSLWYFTFDGVNGSSKLSSFESTPGLSWYNISAISTKGMLSDMQIFGSGGYNLIPVPFVPSQGLFLTVGSDSYADASAAANALDSYLYTSFVSLTNGTGVYSFYSPVSFDDLVSATLFTFLPTTEGGFTNAITSSAWQGTDVPFIVLSGQKGSSGFAHTLEIGSISSSALNATGEPSLVSLFGGTVSALQASATSTSSVIIYKFLDGIVVSSDNATVTSNSETFTGSYTLSVRPGDTVSAINATVVQQPAPLLAQREVDTGVLRTNDSIAVTLRLNNLSPSDTITEVSYSDTWWNDTGVFKLLGGDYSVPTSSISPGGTVTPVYRLQYTGTATGTLTIPASVVHYQYTFGGKTFNATATLNPIRLSLGQDDAVVYAIVSPIGGYDPAVGTPQKFNVTVTNVGTLPASSVNVAGTSISGLAGKSGGLPGGSATVTVTRSAQSLLAANFTGSFTTTYQDPSGATLNATTNVVSDIFSHTSMEVGFPALTVSANMAIVTNKETNLTLSFTVTNRGFANVTSFRATGLLPVSLGCGVTNGTGLSCSAGRVSIDYPLLNTSASFTTTMKYNLASPIDYLMAPLQFQGSTSVENVTGMSNAVAIPTGLALSKVFTPGQLFGGMNSEVTVVAANLGPLPLYDATVGSTVDNFDSLSSSATLTSTSAVIASAGNTTVSYGVTASQTYGNLTATPPTASFYFGGTSFALSGPSPSVGVYQPLSATISTYPTTPEEGKNFTITFVITNPSGVSVSDVQFTLPVPSGLTLSDLRNVTVSSGILSISPGTLGANSTFDAKATAVASSGITVPFQNAKLTFAYEGTTISGLVPSASGIGISEDITTRYLIPTAFVLLVLLFTAFYVRRKAEPSAPSSPK